MMNSSFRDHFSVSIACFALACSNELPAVDGFQQPHVQVEAPRAAEAIERLFDEHGYQLANVRQHGVAPRIYVQRLPSDMAEVSVVPEKKSLFVRTLLPLVLKANEEIADRRAKLLRLRGAAGALSADDRAWVAALARDHGSSSDDLSELLLRVDAVPVSLALAQGIDESGWGTSRFARVDEALFGQHATPGAAASDPSKAKATAVATFDSLLASVRAYFLNLNSGHVYHALRERRAEIRASGRRPTGAELVQTLGHYSERGDGYVSELLSIMHVNELHDYDAVQLVESGGSILVVPEP